MGRGTQLRRGAVVGRRGRVARYGVLAGLVLGLAPGPARAADRLQVFVSILPERALVQAVGGDLVSVTVLVGPGRSPETYAPSPRQLEALGRAQLYLAIGVPFESVWLPRIHAAQPALPIVHLEQGIPRRPVVGVDGQPVPGGPPDPHLWLAPPLAKRLVAHVEAALVARDPAHTAEYRENAARFNARLGTLDTWIRARLAPYRGRTILVFHPAWGYYADAYGLTELPIEIAGKPPGARRLAAILDLARTRRVRTVFVQPQFSDALAHTVARSLGAKVVAVDPLAADYLANLRSATEAFVAAFAREPSP